MNQVILFATALLAGSAQAFWDKGHLMVARKAEQILSVQSPEVMEAALKDLNYLAVSHPDLIDHEKDHPLTECAVFADEIKATFGKFQSPWHFINQPYLDEEGTTVKDFPKFAPPEVNIVDCLTDLHAFLKGDTNAATSEYVSQIAEQFPNEQDQRSFALRLIIHYVGDIHQPLHAVAEVDHKNPKGDMGGNLQKVPDSSGAGVTNLHAIWDSVIYQYAGYQTLPFNTTDWDWISSEVEKIAESHKIDAEKIKDLEFMAWAQESLKLSIETVYHGFVEGEEPSIAYKTAALDQLLYRIMYGGQRLADLITDIYTQEAEETVFLKDLADLFEDIYAEEDETIFLQ